MAETGLDEIMIFKDIFSSEIKDGSINEDIVKDLDSIKTCFEQKKKKD